MKIYSCFTFFNELDLLELRLREMYDHVDMFVIVEGNTTFRSNPKPFLLEQNWDRYSQWHDKIRYIQVNDMPVSDDPWQNESYQRNAIMRGLTDAEPTDLIIIGDVDEILRPSVLDLARTIPDAMIGFKMPLFAFRLNYMMYTQDFHNIWCMGCHRSILDEVTPDDLRRSRHTFNDGRLIRVLDHAGWHFGYLGNNESVAEKIKNFSHSEVDTDEVHNQLDVEESIRNGLTFIRSATDYRYTPVQLDWYMPESILQNLDKYKEWIIPDATKSAVDFLPPWLYNSKE